MAVAQLPSWSPGGCQFDIYGFVAPCGIVARQRCSACPDSRYSLVDSVVGLPLQVCARGTMCHKNVASCVSQKTRTICCMLLQVICSCCWLALLIRNCCLNLNFQLNGARQCRVSARVRNHRQLTKEFSSNSNYSSHKSGRSQLEVRSTYSIF